MTSLVGGAVADSRGGGGRTRALRRFGNGWLTCLQVDPARFNGKSREDIRLALEKLDIESRPVWKPMHLQPVFKSCRARGGAVSEELFTRGLCLPSGSALGESDLQRVVDVIRQLGGVA